MEPNQYIRYLVEHHHIISQNLAIEHMKPVNERIDKLKEVLIDFNNKLNNLTKAK
jgi:tetrahydromethanopterin S-methyltransferase subunit B